MNDAIIKAAVNRFLIWKLPENFNPDAGISFSPSTCGMSYTNYWPIGTNLFTADQAEAMFRYCLEETEAAPTTPTPDPQLCQFYQVTTFPELVAAMEHHIEKLQSKLPKLDSGAPNQVRKA